MKNTAYITKGKTTYISKPDAMIERKSHPKMREILTTENMVQEIKRLYQEKNKKLKKAQKTFKTSLKNTILYPAVLMSTPILITIIYMVALMSTSNSLTPIIDYASIEVFLAIFKSTSNLYTMMGPLSLITGIGYGLSAIFSKNTCKKLTVTTDYLNYLLKETEDQLATLEGQEDLPYEPVEMDKIQSLANEDEEFRESMEDRLELIERLVAIRNTLDEARLERDGYSKEEIQAAKDALAKTHSFHPVRKN